MRVFSELADSAHYVPREETERVLVDLVRCVAKPGEPVALIAHPGFGKTLLLRLVERRLRDKLCCAYLEYGALTATDLASWALGKLEHVPLACDLLREMGQGESDPIERLMALAHKLRAQRSALLLLVDDADGMPAETARSLGEWAKNSRGALRLVLATCHDSRGSRVAAATGVVRSVRLRRPMSERETSLYVRTQLALTRAPDEIVDRADREMIRRIHRLSAGVPRLVQRIAAWELTDLPPGVHVPWGEDGLLDLADGTDDSGQRPDISGAAGDDWHDGPEDLEIDHPEALASDGPDIDRSQRPR